MASRIVIFNNMVTPYTSRLYNALVDQGLDLAVLSCTRQEADRAWANSIEARFEHQTVPGISLGKSGSRFTHINFGIARALDKLRPDVLIVNGFYPSMLAGARWAIRNNKRLALTTDGWHVTMPDTVYHRFARPWLLDRCRAVICCSIKGENYFREQGVSRDRLFRVPLVPAWDAGPTGDFKARPFDLVWCARMNDDCKNAVFFEEVVLALKARYSDLRVRLVGSGVSEPRMISRLSRAAVQFVHDRSIPWSEVGKAYIPSRLLMLPSLFESWGLVCNEAMQCGVPCIVSPHVGAADELIRDDVSGYVRELDVGTWVEAAAGLIRNEPRWTAMSMKAQESARTFTLQAAADAFMGVADHLDVGRMRGEAADVA